jgi:hypothetical protein
VNRAATDPKKRQQAQPGDTKQKQRNLSSSRHGLPLADFWWSWNRRIVTQSELTHQALIGGRTHKSTRSKKSITASVSGILSANFDMDGNATRSNRRCSTDSGEMNGISVTATSIRIGDMAKSPDEKKQNPLKADQNPRETAETVIHPQRALTNQNL